MSQRSYWENAGSKGYGSAMFKSRDVADLVIMRTWREVILASEALGCNGNFSVLDVGCGDGSFAINVLSRRFSKVVGVDFSEQAISRANSNCPENVSFRRVDLLTDRDELKGRYDMVFLVGIIHHLKQSAEEVLGCVSKLTDKIVIMEPNGNNLIRKALEKTASYKAAGEESFTRSELRQVFANVGLVVKSWKKFNVIPNFMPHGLTKIILPFEKLIEKSPLVNGLCTAQAISLLKEKNH